LSNGRNPSINGGDIDENLEGTWSSGSRVIGTLWDVVRFNEEQELHTGRYLLT
jgi:hypothetical protein